MGIYLFNTDILLPELMKDSRGSRLHPRLRPRHSAQTAGPATRCSAYNFVDENKQRALYWRATWARWRPTSRPTWTVAGHLPLSSTFTTSRGPCARGHISIRLPSLSSASPARTGMANQLRGLRRVHRVGVGGAQAPCFRRMCASTPTRMSTHLSSFPTSTSAAIASIRQRHHRPRRAHIPDGTVIGYDINEDKKNYFVSESRPDRVTRDYSVYENPVSPEFLQQGNTW